jgi:hypothetical protein
MSKESARKIEALWKVSGIGGQGAFAKALGVAQSLVSASLAGKPPSVAMWVKLGRFASEKGLYSQAIWCWQQAELPLESILPVANYASKEQRGPATEGEIARVWPFPGAEENTEALPPVPFPGPMIPNPPETFYVSIADRDVFMNPAWRPGDVLAIDRSETDLRKLAFRYVALFRPLDYFMSETGERRKHREQARATAAQESRQYGEWPFEKLGLVAGYVRRVPGVTSEYFILDWYPSGIFRSEKIAGADGRPLRGLVVLGCVVARTSSYPREMQR